MTYESLKSEIEKLGRFESLVQMPDKKDPGWPKWCARASIPGKPSTAGIMGRGDTDLEALGNLVEEMKKF